MKHFLWLLLIPTMAQAISMYSIDDGYHLRRSASLKGRISRISQDEKKASLLQVKGDWRKVCIGDSIRSCANGEIFWVYKDALKLHGKKIATSDDAPTEATHCPTCDARKQHTVKRQNLADAVDPNNPRGFQLPSGYYPACQNFITKKGLGRLGIAMVNTAARNAPDCFYNRNLFGSMCPKYESLPLAKKNALIAMAFAAIASDESHCLEGAQNLAGTNDIADGLFQLEHSRDQRARAGRNRTFCATDHSVDTMSLGFQSQCAVSTVADTVCSWGSTIFDRRGYWQKLRGHREIAQNIQRTIARWGICD